MTVAPVPHPAYPVQLDGRLDARLSRWLWLVKWLLILPHIFVLVFLWAAFFVLSLVAVVAVAVRGRYPPSIFDFNLGVLRWSWRVGFYAYSALGTDRYPPFTLEDDPDYPARLDIPYPDHLPRGLKLVRWWIIALPHYVIAAVFVGVAPWFADRGAGWALPLQGGVVTLIALMAGVVLLFTGRYPRQLFDLELGLNRWVLRAAAYAALMTDVYPPFRLDTGGEQSGTLSVKSETPSATHATRGSTAAIVLGAIAALIGLTLMGGGAAMVVASLAGRDGAGYLSAPAERYATSTYALTSSPAELHLGRPGWLQIEDLIGRVRLQARSDKLVFVGIARTSAANRYLADVGHAVVRDSGGSSHTQRLVTGGSPATAPSAAGIWAATGTGDRRAELTWLPEEGSWTVVVMNTDGSRGVRATVEPATRLPHLGAIGGVVLGTGGVICGLAIALLIAGSRRRVT